jgi:hypothetical protein
MMPLKKPHHMLRVLRAMKEDLSVWLNLFREFQWGNVYFREGLVHKQWFESFY